MRIGTGADMDAAFHLIEDCIKANCSKEWTLQTLEYLKHHCSKKLWEDEDYYYDAKNLGIMKKTDDGWKNVKRY